MRGKGGGYRLARTLDAINLLDITRAIEGPEPAFRCTEIRQNGPCAAKKSACKRPCEFAAAFAAAEQTYRDALAKQTLAVILAEVASNATPEHLTEMSGWVQARVGR